MDAPKLIPPLLGYYTMAGGAAAPAWTPASITGLKIWIDFSDADTLFTDAGSTKVSSDGDLIYQANDKSGTGSNMVQATSDNRPKYKTGIKNSLSAGLFEASDCITDAAPSALGTATDWTCAVVFYIATLRDFNFIISGDWDYIMMHTAANGTVYAGTTTLNRVTTSPGYLQAGTYYILDLTKSGSSAGNLSLNKNGGSNVTNGGNTAPSPAQNKPFTLSNATSNYQTDGYILECLLYDSALDTTNKDLVRTYLNNKWSIY